MSDRLAKTTEFLFHLFNLSIRQTQLMSSPIYALYEPTNDEARRIFERMKVLDEWFGIPENRESNSEELEREFREEYPYYCLEIALDKKWWKEQNPHLFKDEKPLPESPQIIRTLPSPDKCRYFKYGNIDYQNIARNSPDPIKYSIECANPEVLFNCYHALPDDLRRREKDILFYYENGWMIPKELLPTQDELRYWIKGKTLDNQKCADLVREYLLSKAYKCLVRGLQAEGVVLLQEEFQKLSH